MGRTLAVVLLLSSLALADSISDSWVVTGQGKTFSLGNPNLVIPVKAGSYLDFFTLWPANFDGSSVVFNLSYGGHNHFDVSLGDLACCIASAFYSIPKMGLTSATLTVSFLNMPSESFTFRLSTVPEPASLFLLGTGLIGVAWRKFSFRRAT